MPSSSTPRKRRRRDDDVLSPRSKFAKLDKEIASIHKTLKFHNARLDTLEYPPSTPNSSRTHDDVIDDTKNSSTDSILATPLSPSPPTSPLTETNNKTPPADHHHLPYGGTSPYFPHLEEPPSCDSNDTALEYQRYRIKPQVYSRMGFYNGKNHCHSILCGGLQVPSWHTCMTDCIHHLIETKERITEIDWHEFGLKFMTRIKDDYEYLDTYDRLGKTFAQRFPAYCSQYMGDLPDDAHLRAIRIRYSAKHLSKLAHDDIDWWKNIIWKDVLDDLDYVETKNAKHWLQSYHALRTQLSKIDNKESKVDATGRRIIFPPTYHLLENEFAHKLFHKPPPFVDGCLYCKQDKELEDRRQIYGCQTLLLLLYK